MERREDDGPLIGVSKDDLQDCLENMDEVVLLVDDVVIELQLDVESKRTLNLLESLLEGAEHVVSLNLPLPNLTIPSLPQQGIPNFPRLSLQSVGQKFRQGEFSHPLLEHRALKSIPKHRTIHHDPKKTTSTFL